MAKNKANPQDVRHASELLGLKLARETLEVQAGKQPVGPEKTALLLVAGVYAVAAELKDLNISLNLLGAGRDAK